MGRAPRTTWQQTGVIGMDMVQGALGKHISKQFDDDLEAVRTDVLAMGGLVEEQIHRALQALRDVDGPLGEQVVNDDYKINAMEVRIDDECTRIIALRQPTAGDLRMIIAVIKTITDLERIGDEAEKIGRMTMRLAGKTNATSMHRYWGVKNLGKHVSQMVHKALDAFARLDVDAAVQTAREDAAVDEEYSACMRELVTYMMEDPRQISEVMDIIWCARSLERIGDHAKNICEYIIFLVKGKDVRHTSIEHMEQEAQSLT
ncbi:MAG: phosphate transport system protein [Gammaproteobacteria bacterium]|jgi:phosphate transport system protein